MFDIVFGRHRDFGIRVEPAVPPSELCAGERKNRLVALRLRAERLKGGGPFACNRQIVEIHEGPAVVHGRVLIPAGDGEVPPPAVPAPRVRHHHVIAAV